MRPQSMSYWVENPFFIYFFQNLNEWQSDNVQYRGENLYDVPCQHLIFRKIINIDLSSLQSEFNTCTSANKIDPMEQKLLEDDNS